MVDLRVISFKDDHHLHGFFETMLEQARGRLSNVQEKISQSQVGSRALIAWAKENKSYPLMCGFAQELVVYNFNDAGYVARPFTSDAVASSPFTHCAAVVPVLVGASTAVRTIVVDPTYSQFALPGHLYPEFGLKEIYARSSPYQTLSRSPEGQKLWNQITRQGYFEPVKETAALYVNSFCPRAGISPDQALQYLVTPSYHPTNLKHGHGRLKQMACLGIDISSLSEQKISLEKKRAEVQGVTEKITPSF